jgi:UDP-N-acetylmuramate dehydrogenase
LAEKIKNLSNKECQFGYRNSIFKQGPNLIILSVKLRLQKGERKESQKKIQKYLEQRRGQPLEPSAGCVFKNIEIANLHEFEHPKASASWRSYGAGEYHEDGKEFVKIRGQLVPIRDDKIAVGWLIEQCDLKGKQVGQAKISEKHANFIVNLGGAKAEEVIILISLIKQKVRDVFNIQLEEEIEIL